MVGRMNREPRWRCKTEAGHICKLNFEQPCFAGVHPPVTDTFFDA
jgi:hypothetical protein